MILYWILNQEKVHFAVKNTDGTAGEIYFKKSCK